MITIIHESEMFDSENFLILLNQQVIECKNNMQIIYNEFFWLKVLDLTKDLISWSKCISYSNKKNVF